MIKRYLSGLVLATSFLFPLTTQAATLQQRFDQALLGQANGPQAMTLQMTVDFEQKMTSRTEQGSKVSIDLALTVRTVRPEGASLTSSEGQLSINRVRGTMEGTTFDLARPFALEWKQIGGDVYLRATEVSPELRSLAHDFMDLDVDTVVGRWVAFPVGQRMEALLAEVATGTNDANAWKQALTSLVDMSAIRVTGIEKRWKNEAGDQLIRVRGIVNPSMYARLRTEVLKLIDRKATNYRTQVTALDKQIQEVRNVVSKMQFAFTFNETQKRVERSEMGMRVVNPIKRTEMVNRRSVLRTVGQEVLRIAVGVQTKIGSMDAVSPPMESLPFEAYLDLLMPSQALEGDVQVITAS